MFNRLWTKTWRDLWQNRSRSLLVVLSIALSTFTLGVILNSYAVLSREMTQNFLRSNPTAISFSVERFDKDLLSKMKNQKGVGEVDARRLTSGSIRTNTGEWKTLLLFVVNDYNNIRLNIIKTDRGTWPPKKGQILIERQAVSVLKASLGDTVQLKNIYGLSTQLTMTGIAHDVGLPQAEWENVVYGYVSIDTLNLMGVDFYFNQLKISFDNQQLSESEMTAEASNYARWLENKGYQVNGYKVAAQGEHPHANITDGMFMIQKVFAILCCFLSAILVFNLMSAILSKQLGQIGVMKAIGASSKQISRIYYRGVVLLGLLGLLISLPCAYFVGNLYIDKLTLMMNIDISSYRIPIGIILLQILIGIGIPILSAYRPIRKASQLTIKESLLEYDPGVDTLGNSSFEKLILKLDFLTHPLRLAIRNSIRQKGRFILTTGVLMIATALLMASFNIARTMKQVVAVDRSAKQWALKISFDPTMELIDLERLLNEMTEIINTESFKRVNVSLFINDSEKISNKESHHSHNYQMGVVLNYLQLNSNMLSLPMIDGSWLNEPFTAELTQSSTTISPVVVSQLVMDRLPRLKLGGTIKVEIAGQIKILTVIGVAQNIGYPSIYSSELLSEERFKSNGLFISSNKQSKKELNQLKKEVISLAEKHGLKLRNVVTPWDASQVVEGHFNIIFSLMLLLTAIVIFIAANGIILTMTTNISERTRELGVLKAIGATGKVLASMVLTEASLIAILAWVFACLVTLPISYSVAYWLGILLIKTPLELTLEPIIFVISLPAMIAITGLASLVPMRKIMKLSVKNSLLYE